MSSLSTTLFTASMASETGTFVNKDVTSKLTSFLFRKDKGAKRFFKSEEFFKWASLRICDEEFLNNELSYITESFTRLHYPKGFIFDCLNKARSISNRRQTEEQDNPRNVIVPPSNALAPLQVELGSAYRIISATGEKIGNITTTKDQTRPNENSVVYAIKCTSCELSYIGETHRGLNTRIQEHKRDLRLGSDSNSLVIHRDNTGHLPLFEHSTILKRCKNKTTRKLTESVFIAAGPCMNTRESSHKIPSGLAKVIAKKLERTNNRTITPE